MAIQRLLLVEFQNVPMDIEQLHTTQLGGIHDRGIHDILPNHANGARDIREVEERPQMPLHELWLVEGLHGRMDEVEHHIRD